MLNELNLAILNVYVDTIWNVPTHVASHWCEERDAFEGAHKHIRKIPRTKWVEMESKKLEGRIVFSVPEFLKEEARAAKRAQCMSALLRTIKIETQTSLLRTVVLRMCLQRQLRKEDGRIRWHILLAFRKI